ncbi:MAG: hypothetical protein ACRDRL_00255 [Sciscionella sp.]
MSEPTNGDLFDQLAEVITQVRANTVHLHALSLKLDPIADWWQRRVSDRRRLGHFVRGAALVFGLMLTISMFIGTVLALTVNHALQPVTTAPIVHRSPIVSKEP